MGTTSFSNPPGGAPQIHSSRGNFFHHSPSYWGKLLWDELSQIPKGIKGSPMLPFLKLQEAYLSSTEGNARWQWRVPVKEVHPRTSKMGLDGKEVSSYLSPSLPPFLLHVSIMSHTSLARHPSYRRILHLSTLASLAQPGSMPCWTRQLPRGYKPIEPLPLNAFPPALLRCQSSTLQPHVMTNVQAAQSRVNIREM